MVANGAYNYHETKDAEGKSYRPKRWDCYINVPGMKRPKHKRFRGTKRDCENFCMRIRREAESGIRPDAEKVTVAEFMGDYLRNRQAMGEFADSTIARYDEELEAYLKKLLHGEAFDHKGLIYGMGHAVYSLSDPREVVFKGYVEQLAHEKGRDKDLALYAKIERMAPQLIAEERKIFKGVSPNVDFYSGFVYDMLGIPMELYTPLFAVARIMGWSAHRIEELLSANKIIRPAYKSLGGTHDYIPRDAR